MKKNLPTKDAEELKKMSKQNVHEGYKKIISQMLHDFYMEATQLEKPIQTVKELLDFIQLFISLHILPPNQDWKPGDQGK